MAVESQRCAAVNASVSEFRAAAAYKCSAALATERRKQELLRAAVYWQQTVPSTRSRDKLSLSAAEDLEQGSCNMHSASGPPVFS
eukprot:18742-Heterococcus_DN1.PRE.3